MGDNFTHVFLEPVGHCSVKIGQLLCGKGQHGAGYQGEESEFRFHAVAAVCRQMSRLQWIL